MSDDPRRKTEDGAAIDWLSVNRVLVVRLRSIGDTVLITPSLIHLRKFLPHAQIDLLLEDWVAPVLDSFDAVDNILTIGESTWSRLAAAWNLRGRHYDVVINLHGGTTSTFLTYSTGARHRIGYRHYQYAFLHNHLIGPAIEFWNRSPLHSAEQHMALLGAVGVPVDQDQRTRLIPTSESRQAVERRLNLTRMNTSSRLALLHPAAAFDTKQWSVENFARVSEFLAGRGFRVIAIAAKNETDVLDRLRTKAGIPMTTFDDLTLPEITAIASRADLFVGNDSGVAHIAAAVGTPSVVIFGSSNRDHWRPWTDAPNEIVFNEFACQPCPGHTCAQFGEPRCILSVTAESVFRAIDRVLEQKKGREHSRSHPFQPNSL